MPNLLTLCCIAVVTLSGFADSEESPLRSSGSERRISDGEVSDIFNKTLASKDSSKYMGRGARTPPTPPTRVMPSYSPPSRTFFTPPLPPEYLHPFADKPTLRGSNSDGVNVGGRRPIPPPPPFRLPPEELIPIRPPDLQAPHDTKKKTLNTPSFKKVADSGGNFPETSSTTSSNSPRINDTFDFVPMISYPSISRILFSGNGRKHDSVPSLPDKIIRIEHDKEPRTIKQEIIKGLIPPVKQEEPPVVRKPILEVPIDRETVAEEVMREESETKETSVDRTEPPTEQERVEPPRDTVESEAAAPRPERPEPRTRHVLGVAWDIHVYLVAALFALLALCSLVNMVRLVYRRHLLSRGYFLSVHGMLLVVGCMRTFYLFYDAYNIDGSLPEPVSSLLLNMVFPLITSAFAVLFLFLVSAAEVKVLNDRLQKGSLLAVLIMLHLALNFSVHLYSNDTPYSTLLPLVCQCVFIVVCVALGLAYLYLYKSLSQCCLRKGGPHPGVDCDRWSLAQAVRVTLATAMLSLLMAAVHLYGMLGVYEVLSEGRPQPWLWWGFQLSVRVIEVSMCFLLGWAGMQRDSTPSVDRGPPAVDDIYPAICTTNQAYTLRATKAFDAGEAASYPLNTLHQGPNLLVGAHLPERRSLKKQPSLERRLQPSPSMLVAENGFVRFRTIADADLPPDDPIHEYA